jgi:hypothetical protein
MEFLTTLHPGNKTGTRITNEVYNTIKDAILSLLLPHDGMPSAIFFGMLHKQLVGELGENTGWYIFQVKLDMEARGLIKSEFLKDSKNTKAIIKILKRKRSLRFFNRM